MRNKQLQQEKPKKPIRYPDFQQNPWSVYLIFNLAKTVNYVGSSCKPMRRFYQHSLESKWHQSEVSYIQISWFDSKKKALYAEKTAIKKHKPKYNVLGLVIKKRGSFVENFLIDPLKEPQ